VQQDFNNPGDDTNLARQVTKTHRTKPPKHVRFFRICIVSRGLSLSRKKHQSSAWSALGCGPATRGTALVVRVVIVCSRGFVLLWGKAFTAHRALTQPGSSVCNVINTGRGYGVYWLLPTQGSGSATLGSKTLRSKEYSR